MSEKDKLQPLKCPTSIAIFEYILAADRPVHFAELVEMAASLPADQHGRTPSARMNYYLPKLTRHRLDNINPKRGEPGIYALSQLAKEQIKGETIHRLQADAAPAPAPAKWVGQSAAPRTYDVMDSQNVYVPPPSLRKGGKSVREEIEDHATRQQAAYIPVL
jgi:hypothetical protein